MLELVETSRRHQASDEITGLVNRALQDQYVIKDGERVILRPEAEVPGQPLQSPHDPETTYRTKGGEGYQGYVANLSETSDSDSPVQLLTTVQVAPNTTGDGLVLAGSLAEQSGHGSTVDKMTVDRGYTGETGETACRDHQV